MAEPVTVASYSFTHTGLRVHTTNGLHYTTTFDQLRAAFRDLPDDTICRILSTAFATTRHSATTTPVPNSSLSVTCTQDGANELQCTIKDSHIATCLPSEGIPFNMQRPPTTRTVFIDDTNHTHQQPLEQLHESVTGGTIVSCTVKDTQLQVRQFRKVFESVCAELPPEKVGVTVILNVSDVMNVRTVHINTRGYKWYPEWGISIQGLDANRTLHAVRKLCWSQRWRLQMQLDVPLLAKE